MKIDIVILSGRPEEHKRLTSRATSRQLREGTASFNSAEIAQQLDFWAGTLKMPVGLDTSNIKLYCMTKHFPKLLPLFAEIIQQPTFPQQELDTFVENNIQNLAVELTKNDVIAYRTITELAYGADMPYGYNSMPDDYRALTSEDLKQFHRNHYTSDNMLIFLCSGITDGPPIGTSGRPERSLTSRCSSMSPKRARPAGFIVGRLGSAPAATSSRIAATSLA